MHYFGKGRVWLIIIWCLVPAMFFACNCSVDPSHSSILDVFSGSDPDRLIILDVFDLVEQYYVEQVDRREMVGYALGGLLDKLKEDVQIEVRRAEIKEILQARDSGETSPTPEPPDEESPTPIPTPYDQVEVKATLSDIAITINNQSFLRELPSDKRKLARVILDGVDFYTTNLNLPDSREALVQKALNAMLSKLDPHSGFLDLGEYENLKQDTEGAFGGVGVEIGMRNGFLTVIAPIEGTPAAQAGLEAKDRIVAIDGTETIGQTLTWAVQRIRGEIGTAVTLTIKRAGKDQPFDVSVMRAKIQAVATKTKILPGGIGYVRIVQFSNRTTGDLKKAMEMFQADPGVRVLLLDFRNNPGGLLKEAVSVADMFLDSGLIVNTIGRGFQQEREHFATGPNTNTSIPLLVLVNSGTASASEIVVGALKDRQRAVVVGYQTFGKGSVQSVYQLRNDTGLRLTTARYYTPSGASIQANGITPDLRFNVPEEEKSLYILESDIPGHLKSRSEKPPAPPAAEVDALWLYEHYKNQGLIKEEDDYDEENDMLLVFIKQLLETDDLSRDALIARGATMLAAIPKPPEKKVDQQK